MIYKENALDWAAYCRLRASVGWGGYTKEQAQRALEHSLYTIVAMEGDQAAGMGRLVGDGIYDTLVDVVVKPEYQGQGIGRRMIQKILEEAERQTPAGGRVTLQLIAAEGKEPFYEKFGFTKLPDENSGAGMRKMLQKR